MNRRAYFVSFLTLVLVILAFNPLQAVGKPDVTSHEATFLGNAVDMHIEWQSPNPVIMARIAMAGKAQDLIVNVDLFDNRRNPSGYAGEVNVTVHLDSLPNQPLNYVIQLEDELQIKSTLVTGKVNVSSSQQTQHSQQSLTTAPASQSPQQPGAKLDGQQFGTIIIIINPSTVANSGAMWRVENGQWKKSEESHSNLPVGSHTIEYKDVDNWIKPENQTVKIGDGQTLTLKGIYKTK